MSDDNSVMRSIGLVEGWIEKAAEQYTLSTAAPLRDLKVVQDAYVALLRKSQLQKNALEGIVDIAVHV